MTKSFFHIRCTGEKVRLALRIQNYSISLNRDPQELVQTGLKRLYLNLKRSGAEIKMPASIFRGCKKLDANILSWAQLLPEAFLQKGPQNRAQDGPETQNGEELLYIQFCEEERIPILINPPKISEMRTHAHPYIGCPLPLHYKVEFENPSLATFAWYRARRATADPEGPCIARGACYVPTLEDEHCWLIVDGAVGDVWDESGGFRLRLGPMEVRKDFESNWNLKRLSVFGGDLIREENMGKNIFEKSTDKLKTIATFNILAPIYARSAYAETHMYPHASQFDLDEKRRLALLGLELILLNADILALQELSEDVYQKFILPLTASDYHSYLGIKKNQASEGCATLVRKSLFDLITTETYLFSTLLLQEQRHAKFKAQLQELWPDFLSTAEQMSTIFHFTILRNNIGEIVIVANTHLYYHAQASHIRLIQIYILCLEAQRLCDAYSSAPNNSAPNNSAPNNSAPNNSAPNNSAPNNYAPNNSAPNNSAPNNSAPNNSAPKKPHFILCGDLNSVRNSGVVHFLNGEAILPTHPDWQNALNFKISPEKHPNSSDNLLQDISERCKGPELKLEMELVNGYGGKNERALFFTHSVAGFHGILDHIYFSPHLGQVRKVLEGPKELKDLPSGVYPSDHISIAVELI